MAGVGSAAGAGSGIGGGGTGLAMPGGGAGSATTAVRRDVLTGFGRRADAGRGGLDGRLLDRGGIGPTSGGAGSGGGTRRQKRTTTVPSRAIEMATGT